MVKETNIGPRHWSELYPHYTKFSTKPPYDNIAAISSPVTSTITQKLLGSLHMRRSLNSVLVLRHNQRQTVLWLKHKV